MANNYIVVDAIDAQLVRVALGMLYAERYEYDYPMPGPSYYVWDPKPNAAGTRVAFGPLDSLGGTEADFGAWCCGRGLETDVGTITIPAVAETLEASWFPPPPPEEPEDPEE
jgi:hypothetical protein